MSAQVPFTHHRAAWAALSLPPPLLVEHRDRDTRDNRDRDVEHLLTSSQSTPDCHLREHGGGWPPLLVEHRDRDNRDRDVEHLLTSRQSTPDCHLREGGWPPLLVEYLPHHAGPPPASDQHWFRAPS